MQKVNLWAAWGKSKAFEPRDLEIYAFCIYLSLSFDVKNERPLFAHHLP